MLIESLSLLKAFQRIELYRGNAPPSFAASPIGGVINLVTGEHTSPAAGTVSYGQMSTTRLTVTADQRGKIGKYCPILHYMAEGGGHNKTSNTLDPQRTHNRQSGAPMVATPQPHQHQEKRQPSGD